MPKPFNQVLFISNVRYTRADPCTTSYEVTYGVLQFLRCKSEPRNQILQQVRRTGTRFIAGDVHDISAWRYFSSSSCLHSSNDSRTGARFWRRSP